jgi:hypothetical protein
VAGRRLDGRDALLIVGSNAAATGISNNLRAELVRLGRVEEVGVRLGMQDPVATATRRCRSTARPIESAPSPPTAEA